jgi:long-chain acyl-CoA synthetase
MRACFGLRVSGSEHLPESGQFVLTPNHSSSLDPLVLAAALPFELLCRAKWAGRRKAIVGGPVRRWLNRAARAVPVDPDVSALAAAAAVLRQGDHLIWFPEGTRTRTGRLQPFQPGIGLLLRHFDVPAVPALIVGAYNAMPPNRGWPKFRRISLRLGRPVSFADTIENAAGSEKDQIERFLEVLRENVARLE